MPGKVRHFGRDGPEADAGRRDASARAVPCPEREDGHPRLPRRRTASAPAFVRQVMAAGGGLWGRRDSGDKDQGWEASGGTRQGSALGRR